MLVLTTERVLRRCSSGTGLVVISFAPISSRQQISCFLLPMLLGVTSSFCNQLPPFTMPKLLIPAGHRRRRNFKLTPKASSPSPAKEAVEMEEQKASNDKASAIPRALAIDTRCPVQATDMVDRLCTSVFKSLLCSPLYPIPLLVSTTPKEGGGFGMTVTSDDLDTQPAPLSAEQGLSTKVTWKLWHRMGTHMHSTSLHNTTLTVHTVQALLDTPTPPQMITLLTTDLVAPTDLEEELPDNVEVLVIRLREEPAESPFRVLTPPQILQLPRQWAAPTLHRVELALPELDDGTQCTLSLDACYPIVVQDAPPLVLNLEWKVHQTLALDLVNASWIYGVPVLLQAALQEDPSDYQATRGLVAAFFQYLQQHQVALELRDEHANSYLIMTQETERPVSGILVRYATSARVCTEAAGVGSPDPESVAYMEQALSGLDHSGEMTDKNTEDKSLSVVPDSPKLQSPQPSPKPSPVSFYMSPESPFTLPARESPMVFSQAASDVPSSGCKIAPDSQSLHSNTREDHITAPMESTDPATQPVVESPMGKIENDQPVVDSPMVFSLPPEPILPRKGDDDMDDEIASFLTASSSDDSL